MPAPAKKLEVVDVPQPVNAELAAFKANSQHFFDELMEERNKPHCGDQWRSFVDGVCKRARERGMWSPPPPQVA